MENKTRIFLPVLVPPASLHTLGRNETLESNKPPRGDATQLLLGRGRKLEFCTISCFFTYILILQGNERPGLKQRTCKTTQEVTEDGEALCGLPASAAPSIRPVPDGGVPKSTAAAVFI